MNPYDKDPETMSMADAHIINKMGVQVSNSKTRQKLARKMFKKGLWG